MTRALVLLLALSACGGADEPMTVVTYNAGLAPGFVDGAASRTAPVAAAIGLLDADVVCLQEVWTPGDIAAVKAATTGFEHQLWPEGSQDVGADPGCSEVELDKLIGCVEDTCADQCSEYLDDCMLANCAVKFINVSGDCQGCVMANVGEDVATVRRECATSYPKYAFNGSYGTALLSKHPIVSSEHHPMDATTNRRGVHHAVVKGPAGKVDVYCTHFTAVFTLLPYPKESGDWDVEQRAQASSMIDLVQRTAETEKVVLLGDFNSGPAIGDDIAAVELTTHSKFIDAGYADPYADLAGDCTWCGDNPLIGGGDSTVLDHVYVKGFAGQASAERVLDDALDIQVCDEEADGALSDHFGVRVTLVP